jgi:hypothetical protein
MARHRSLRTYSVPLTALGSGARVMDLFPIPIWLFVPFRITKWCFRHWWLFGTVIAYLFLDWRLALAILLSFPLWIFGYLYLHNRHHTPSAVARAAFRLARTRLAWARACEAAELNDGRRRPRLVGWKRHPRIANEHGSALEFTLNLARIGKTVKHLEDSKDYIAASLSARRSRVNRLTPGVGRLTIEWERKAHRSAVANPANQIVTSQLPKLELDQDVFIELDTSLLVVGESGAGKSNLTWYMLNELNKLGVPYRLYVIDPKKVELADLVDSPYTVAYADTSAGADQVIDKFNADMMRTFERMKALGIRYYTIGPEFPLNLLIIDELLLCKAARQGIDGPMGEVLSSGRAAGYICVANSQLGQVDAISRLRDLFPQRVCMANKSPDLTNATLGPHAEQRGARCSEITEKGVGYVHTDFTNNFQRFKPPYVDDVRTVALGGVWEPTQFTGLLGRKKRSVWYTYRLYDRFAILLYVGKAANPNKRIPQHKDQPFWDAIDHGKTVIRRYPSEEAAFEAEQEAIENEHPRFNLIHNFK